jgi:hypothetical protein
MLKLESTNEEQYQGCFPQNLVVPEGLFLRGKLFNSHESCDKNIPGPVDKS